MTSIPGFTPSIRDIPVLPAVVEWVLRCRLAWGSGRGAAGTATDDSLVRRRLTVTEPGRRHDHPPHILIRLRSERSLGRRKAEEVAAAEGRRIGSIVIAEDAAE